MIFPEVLTVRIEQSHIEKARELRKLPGWNTSQSCPFALASKEALPTGVCFSFVGNYSLMCYNPINMKYALYEGNSQLGIFTFAFDLDQPILPFTFLLHYAD